MVVGVKTVKWTTTGKIARAGRPARQPDSTRQGPDSLGQEVTDHSNRLPKTIPTA